MATIIVDEIFQDTEYSVSKAEHKNVFILEAGDINHDRSNDESNASILKIIDH